MKVGAFCVKKGGAHFDTPPFNCLLYPDGTDTQGRFVYILRNKEIYDELIADGFIKASVEIEQHLEDGLAIVFYIMKCP